MGDIDYIDGPPTNTPQQTTLTVFFDDGTEAHWTIPKHSEEALEHYLTTTFGQPDTIT